MAQPLRVLAIDRRVDRMIALPFSPLSGYGDLYGYAGPVRCRRPEPFRHGALSH